MFGIKTKKDKKIEALQREIDSLKQSYTERDSLKQSYTKIDVNTLCSELVLPFEALNTITEEHIKRVLAIKMLEVVEENLEIEHTTDDYKRLKIYNARLKVIKM